MKESIPEQDYGSLPVPAPDLILVEGPGEHWKVQTMSGFDGRTSGTRCRYGGRAHCRSGDA